LREREKKWIYAERCDSKKSRLPKGAAVPGLSTLVKGNSIAI